MNIFFGWVQGSDMPSTYVHLSGRDVDNALLQLYGLKKQDHGEKDTLTPRLCPRCEYTNAATSSRCDKCGMILDPKKAMEIQEKIQSFEGLMSALMEHPEVSSAMMKAWEGMQRRGNKRVVSKAV